MAATFLAAAVAAQKFKTRFSNSHSILKLKMMYETVLNKNGHIIVKDKVTTSKRVAQVFPLIEFTFIKKHIAKIFKLKIKNVKKNKS